MALTIRSDKLRDLRVKDCVTPVGKGRRRAGDVVALVCAADEKAASEGEEGCQEEVETSFPDDGFVWSGDRLGQHLVVGLCFSVQEVGVL